MSRILVANRGEIACRIIRSINKMGHTSIAVYSDADRDAKHVREADESYHIGPAAAKDSYLRIDTLIALCKEQQIDMVHPGYGFLSENAEFAKALDHANITFIGPGIEAITTMGSKLAAKDAVSAYDIPMVPGVDHAVEDVDEAIAIAKQIGFPILIKASAGGGGKGMRMVESEDVLQEQMQMAISEAISAFGDGAVFIEKYVRNPRHIEIQVLADNHGNVVHLFERECSIQRRHQKVIEEAPSSVLSKELRSAMGAAAIRVAQACNYSGAGTVEFLLNDEGDFYFLEMNTRLQVEHPVTEMITGIDLVEQQIRVAQGEKLGFTQDDIQFQGHAIELRIYAEDPLNDFLPDIGKITRYHCPEKEYIRLDDAFEEGSEIPIFYDPMIAKLCTYGKNRSEAIERMKEAIANFELEGIKNTLEFGNFVMHHEAFQSGKFDTNFVKEHFTPEALKLQESESFEAVASLFGYLKKQRSHQHLIANV